MLAQHKQSNQKNYEPLELDVLLTGIRHRYGYDFTGYSTASLQRRIRELCQRHGINRLTELLDRVFHDEALFEELLQQLSITVTDLFRDPPFWAAMREKVVPLLKTFPFVKIWHAGCATGEEAYSMAILLQEEGFLHRAHIYATDFNQHSLAHAKKAVYAQDRLLLWEQNYQAAGGKAALSDYYHSGYQLVKFKDTLQDRLTFSYHNLVTDGVFGEMNLILCRNVLIYFDQELQSRAHRLFADSLCYSGILCLGTKETLDFTDIVDRFTPFDKRLRIYKKAEARHA